MSRRLPGGRRASPDRDSGELYRLVAKGRDRERRRIAQELHDGALQSLVGIRLDIEKLVSEIEARPPREVAGELAELSSQIRGCIKEIRAILSDMEPPNLEGIDAVEALHRCVDAFRDRHHPVQVRRHLQPMRTPLSSEQKLGLFRILQEALNNVGRHAQASHVAVELKAKDGAVELQIRDDGRGFDVHERERDPRHCGLKNIRNRAAALGGSTSVQSSPGHGAVVIAQIPLAAAGSNERRKD